MAEPKYIELIDRYLIKQGKGDYNPPSYEWVDNTGEIVRCKDCKYGDTGTDEDGRRFYKCIGIHYGGVSPDDYCSYGERKDG